MPKLRPAPNPAPEPEIEDHAPPTEAIEIELAPEEPLEAEVELAPAPAPAPRPEPAPTPAAPSNEDALVRAAEATRRAEELQRQNAELSRQNRERDEELARVRQEGEDAQYNSLLTAIQASQATLDKSEADHAAAMAAGDWATASKIQRMMAVEGARLASLEDGKTAFEQRRETTKTNPASQPAPQPSSDPVEQRIASMPVPDTAKNWLREHRDYLTDVRKNAKLQAAHWDALDDAGGESQIGTAKYIEALETRLGIRQPAAAVEPAPEPSPAPQPQRRSTIPMTAPVSRDVPSPSGQRPSSSKITLSAEERQIAHASITDPSISNAEKERLYALGKKRMNEMKANGTYGQERQ